MSDMRSCIKPGCRWPAAATLSYRYGTGEVWLSDLGELHPATHDLCPHHADNLRVPKGWTLVDERRPAPVVHEPSAAQIVERVATLRETVDRRLEQGPPKTQRRSRYEDLLEDLPTYNPDGSERLSDVKASEPTPIGSHDGIADAPEPVSVGVPSSTVRAVETPPPTISHEMAPVPRNLPALAAAIAEHAAKEDGEAPRAVVLTLPLRTELSIDDHPSDQ